MEFNGFVPPHPNSPIPSGLKILPGNPKVNIPPPVYYELSPIINEDSFQMNIGGEVPSSWTINQIAHYVQFAGPDDSVFTEKAKILLRAKGYAV
ncbi:gamete release protein, putative [Plasmodium gallinaceum]|uniref:Gamete release protein, putative n=1 Tax=Plasmodium gallinaceum TaxID=5849 RepID=A0A1J1GLL6_PLAGA|nr:gamete release protein, putative [Plasmodium gallinaceum]CRG93109.1 gamete release protein, putative [Plasmodium gallinaceum]